jgi:hypothetical protein
MAKELTLPPGECPIANFVGNLIFSLLSGRQSGLPDCAPTPNFQTSSEGCHSRKLLSNTRPPYLPFHRYSVCDAIPCLRHNSADWIGKHEYRVLG